MLFLLNFKTQPDVLYVTQQNPLIGLINTIGFKISNTADFFQQMLRGTIQVIKAYNRKQTLLQRKVSAHTRKNLPKKTKKLCFDFTSLH